jgi:pyruvate/2-oxoglutarate dehydrogenase complex dihydrolipoamide acyltransferase (E2) component
MSQENLEIVLTAVLAVTTDHRILDGAPSARFLGRVRTLMEQPLLLLEKGI